jgi:hypothetical protein
MGNPISDADRALLSKLCSRKNTRFSIFTKKRPTRWNPTTVLHPTYKSIFTDTGAWMYISDLLTSGFPFWEMNLTVPPDEKGYVAIWTSEDEPPVRIYIKLQILQNQVLGRSFHYCTKEEADVYQQSA